MALTNERYPQIFTEFPTDSIGPDDIILVYKPSTGQLHGIEGINVIPSSEVSQYKWVGTFDYQVGDPVLSSNKWWISLQTPNINNIPSENAFWTQVNKVTGSALRKWIPGLYVNDDEYVVHDLVLYELNPSPGTPRPFNSTIGNNPLVDSGNWTALTGGGGGVTAEEIQNSTYIYDEDSGSENAYSIVPVPPYTVHNDGMMFIFKAVNKNTGGSTLDDGLDTAPIVRRDGTPLKAGDIPLNSMNLVVRSGSQWQLITSTSSDDVIPFVYRVSVGAMETISLPMETGFDGEYNFKVNYGDGSPEKNISTYADPDRLHQYTVAGEYDVTITGLFNYIKFIDSPASLIEVKSWGQTRVGTASFRNCVNFTTISATDVPLARSSSFLQLFENAPLTSVNPSINNWDVSSVVTFQKVFSGSQFNSNIASWDVSNGAEFSSMFSGNSAFNQDINSWDVSSATTMSGMFLSATSFNQDLNSWDVSNVVSFSAMFRLAASFNQDLNSWTPTSALNMNSMFVFADAFNGNISSWDVSSVNDMGKMFTNCFDFNQDLSGWNVSNVTDFAAMFSGCSSFNQDLSGWVTTAATTMNSMFQNCTVFNQDIGGWDLNGVTDIANMLRSCLAFDQDLSGWNVTTITTAQSFLSGSTLSTVNYDALLIGWEAQAVQNGVSFHGGSSTYTGAGAAGTARADLIADHSWVITDGGSV